MTARRIAQIRVGSGLVKTPPFRSHDRKDRSRWTRKIQGISPLHFLLAGPFRALSPERERADRDRARLTLASIIKGFLKSESHRSARVPGLCRIHGRARREKLWRQAEMEKFR